MKLLSILLVNLFALNVFAAECDRDTRQFKTMLPGDYTLFIALHYGVVVSSEMTTERPDGGDCRRMLENVMERLDHNCEAAQIWAEHRSPDQENLCYQEGVEILNGKFGDEETKSIEKPICYICGFEERKVGE